MQLVSKPRIEAFMDEHLPRLRAHHVTVIVNIAGESVDEYAELAKIIDGSIGVAGIEINISCPNVAREECSSAPIPAQPGKLYPQFAASHRFR